MNKNISRKEEIAVVILIIVLATGFLIYFVNRFRGVDLEKVIEENVAELEQVEKGYLDKLTAGMNNFLAQTEEPAVETIHELFLPEEEVIAAIKKELEEMEQQNAELESDSDDSI